MSQTAFQLSPVFFLLVSLFIDGQVPEHSNKRSFCVGYLFNVLKFFPYFLDEAL